VTAVDVRARNREKAQRHYWRHREEIAERRHDPDYLARHRAYKVRERARHGDRIAARNAVTHSLERGEIRRGPCAECGAAAQAHHHRGYEPQFHLDVVWLCRTHHGKAHRMVVVAA